MLKSPEIVLAVAVLALTGCRGGGAGGDDIGQDPIGDAADAGDGSADGGSAQPTTVVTGDGGTSPLVCTSNVRWKTGNKGDETMNPGTPCITCHDGRGKGTNLLFAGTLYPTLHEPDDCFGVTDGGAVVEVTDKNGKVVTAAINASGNFLAGDGAAPIVFPAKVKVIAGAKTRQMMSEISHGDCNLCHTAAGAFNAHGRVILP
ncbi:MAG: hypothetical protein ACT4TC_00095 [Myxococcaceae bacterium]